MGWEGSREKEAAGDWEGAAAAAKALEEVAGVVIVYKATEIVPLSTEEVEPGRQLAVRFEVQRDQSENWWHERHWRCHQRDVSSSVSFPQLYPERPHHSSLLLVASSLPLTPPYARSHTPPRSVRAWSASCLP